MASKQKARATILWLEEVDKRDVKLVGGKNASLGEMYSQLQPMGIAVPNGFAITTNAFKAFLERGGLQKQIKEKLRSLDTGDLKSLQQTGQEIRQLILDAELPRDLQRRISQAYAKLGRKASVAVRSSATTEDTAEASFAGQQDTYLNVVGEQELLQAIKKTFASLFTDRAISYRKDKGFNSFGALSVGVQKMVRADKGAAGVLFTIDPETGFDKAVVINGSWGLGEMVVQGEVTPDEFVVFKPMLEKKRGIIEKTLGPKKQKLIYGAKGTKKVAVPEQDRKKLCLEDKEVSKLALWGTQIEKHFGKPMDIEWAKDDKGKLFVVQARPETVHANAKNIYKEYSLKTDKTPIITGMGVGMKIAAGKVRVIASPKDMGKFQKGEVLVTENTDPDWEPIMKGAVAVVTDKGGRTSHAAIISRELGIAAIVGTGNATKKLKTGQTITVDCSSGDEGRVYGGALKFEAKERHFGNVPETKTKIMLNIGAPDEAFKNAWLPVKGVGLGRLEFIINSYIKIHPNALIEYRNLKGNIKKQIDELTMGYSDKKQFYIDKMAEGIAKIAAAFWPHEVIIRFSDFKTNEYRQLIGGELYEMEEQNPMLGWRGASRYYDPRFEKAFGLECLAIKKVREEMGLANVTPMVPFCRTPEEGRKVIRFMRQHGLSRQEDAQLRIYVMCEIPSNVLLADEFLDVFDGMSIGSNDLTQLALGIDRDSGMGAAIANENDPAVRQLIAAAIAKCKERGKYVGICGQAPSDYPEFTKFLIEQGIESISLNPDAVFQTIMQVKKVEEELGYDKQ
ncbi:MAG TPA: phosphoenolpyruvate synthase [Candidatus Paceibacterota bacterium]